MVRGSPGPGAETKKWQARPACNCHAGVPCSRMGAGSRLPRTVSRSALRVFFRPKHMTIGIVVGASTHLNWRTRAATVAALCHLFHIRF